MRDHGRKLKVMQTDKIEKSIKKNDYQRVNLR